ncbi:hypothetical protein Barb6XT_00393 [Bacteroidales bacterium Barb6XT]|nr:hypothetical protein Barb6XT_00393 [Bacteroidales bacterium Barb6XT]
MEAQIENKRWNFPNGKVNQEYCYEFDISKFMPEAVVETIDGLEEVGLTFDMETKQVAGTPNVPGEHKIKLTYKPKDWAEGKPVLEKEIGLIINPDPRSLWNDIPTDETIDYFKPDSDTRFIKVMSQKDMAAASKRGRSHAHEGKARDDDFSLHFDKETGWYIMVVADGAGSAKFSREGSKIACQTAIDVCKEQLLSLGDNFEREIQLFDKDKSQEKRNDVGKILYEIAGNAAFKAHKNIEKEARQKGNPVKDYSTTFILSISKKFNYGWFVGAFWVGDGGIGIYDKDTQYLKILGEPDGGEFAGQTRFLTMPEIIQPAEIYRRLRFDIVPDFTALILMTDGITDPKFETDANLSRIEKWNDLWADLCNEVDFTDSNERVADQLLKWLDFWSQGNHDDRTIAILF